MQISRGSPLYSAPEGVLVILINATVEGPQQRRLAAKFLLDCLRGRCTKKDLTARLDRLEQQALLGVVGEARRLASRLNLVA